MKWGEAIYHAHRRSSQGEADLDALDAILGCNLRAYEIEGFTNMHEKLVGGQDCLTEPQRAWLIRSCERLHVDTTDLERDPEPVRFTIGPPPRGKEVEILVRDKPLKPPGRR